MSLLDIVQPVPPDVAIEIESTHVAAARMAWRSGAASIVGHAVEPLPAGAVVPSLAAANINDIALVTRALRQALSRLGGRVSRAALVIPDTAAKVSLVRFDNVPASTSDLTELVRWQVRKTAPFPFEQAIVSYTPGVKPAEGGQEFVVTVARHDLVAQYEEACSGAGVHAGLVDISTFSIINGVLAASSAPQGDWLLVHATAAYATLAVLRGEDLIFFRNREEESEGTLADVVHQTAMYYEDRLKGEGFTRVMLAGGAVHGADAVRHSLEQRLDVRIDAVAQPDLAALIGILARERKVA
jgi:Tfp pilus assembly PilM family ATPase